MIGEEKSPAANCASIVTHIVPGCLYILLLIENRKLSVRTS